MTPMAYHSRLTFNVALFVLYQLNRYGIASIELALETHQLEQQAMLI